MKTKIPMRILLKFLKGEEKVYNEYVNYPELAEVARDELDHIRIFKRKIEKKAEI